MLVNPISLSGMCSVIAPRLPPCRRSVPRLLEPGACPRHPRVSQVDRPLPCGLFRVSLLDQGGPPTAVRARWRPWAAAAPCLRHRSGGPRPLSAQHRQGGQPEQEATRLARIPGPSRDALRAITPPHRPPSCNRRPEAVPSAVCGSTTRRPEGAQPVTHSGSVAEGGTGLLETHVTGARSAPPPLWLTFGG